MRIRENICVLWYDNMYSNYFVVRNCLMDQGTLVVLLQNNTVARGDRMYMVCELRRVRKCLMDQGTLVIRVWGKIIWCCYTKQKLWLEETTVARGDRMYIIFMNITGTRRPHLYNMYEYQ